MSKYNKSIVVKPAKNEKVPGFPRRPLSAYNIFFKVQRYCIINGVKFIPDITAIQEIIEMEDFKSKNKRRVHRTSHGKIGFAELARQISQSWNICDASLKAHFQELSKRDKKRYDEEKIQFSVHQLTRHKLTKTHPDVISFRNDSKRKFAKTREHTDLEPLPLSSYNQACSLDENAREFILSALSLDE
jgi:hypothetical protein